MLPGDDVIKWAIQKREELVKDAEELSNAQSEKYNDWAMENIQNCLDKCKGGVGVFSNGKDGRETISEGLIKYLGPIDRRFLTSEVARALSEVENKYLAPNQLNPVKDEHSIEENGNILYTLKEMYEKKKVSLTRF